MNSAQQRSRRGSEISAGAHQDVYLRKSAARGNCYMERQNRRERLLGRGHLWRNSQHRVRRSHNSEPVLDQSRGIQDRHWIHSGLRQGVSNGGKRFFERFGDGKGRGGTSAGHSSRFQGKCDAIPVLSEWGSLPMPCFSMR